jgi:hypothetical protein
MASKDVYTVTLRLDNIEALFEVPDVSPFSDSYREYSYTSGIEFIADELYANTSYEKVQALLIVPRGQIEPGLDERVKAAVQRYARGRLIDTEHEIDATRWRGMRSLGMAIIALFMFIGASYVTGDSESIVLQIISEGLGIAGWVVLWVPLEMLFFSVWEHRLDKKIYRLLMEMDIAIIPSQ